jgi:hypothetical protein
MSTDLTTPFDLSNAPDHIKQTELSKSLATTQSIMIPRIVFNGKGSWEMKLGSELQKSIESKDLNVIIVGVAEKISRAFYEDSYTPGFAKPPVCWSADSTAPNHAIVNPQASACATCPKNIKGSNGSKPCRFFRRIAVVSPDDINGQIYQMQLPSTTIFPKNDGTKMAFNGYVNYLNSKNTPIDRVITQMYFDDGVSYGKLFFSAIGFVDEESVGVLETLIDAPEIQEAITTSYSLINDEESKTGFVESNAVPKDTKASLFTVTDEPAEKPKIKTRKKKDVPDIDTEELDNILKNWGDEDNKEVDD